MIIADIEKMYRQFLVRPEDRKYQQVLWLSEGQVKEYTLNTITFGVASVLFLARRCLHQLAEDEVKGFPLASRVLKRDMFVDNMLTGTDLRSDAWEIYGQVTQVLRTAGIKMRQ